MPKKKKTSLAKLHRWKYCYNIAQQQPLAQLQLAFSFFPL